MTYRLGVLAVFLVFLSACGGSSSSGQVGSVGSGILSGGGDIAPIVGNWVSEREEGGYKHIVIQAQPPLLVYEWYGAGAGRRDGDDRGRGREDHGRYAHASRFLENQCSYRLTSIEFSVGPRSMRRENGEFGVVHAVIQNARLLGDSQSDPRCREFLRETMSNESRDPLSFDYGIDRQGDFIQNGWVMKRVTGN